MRGLKRTITVALVATVVAPAIAALPAEAGATRAPLVLWGAGTPTADGAGGVYGYNADLVPPGSALGVVSVSRTAETRTGFVVTGLRPNWSYLTHLHVNPCGAVPTAAGGHYQQVPDPVQPSTDPAYVNPTNEVWLNVDTDSRGKGTATSHNPWRYRTAPGSLVLHAGSPTGNPGAGPVPPGTFVACVTLSRP